MEEPEHDEYIEAMIPVVITMIENYCNLTLTNKDDSGRIITNGNEFVLLDSSFAIIIAKIIEFYMLKSGVTSEAISRVSYGFATELPANILTMLNARKRMKFL